MSKKIFLPEKTMSVNASNSKQEENQPEKNGDFSKNGLLRWFFPAPLPAFFQHSPEKRPFFVFIGFDPICWKGLKNKEGLS